MATSYVDYAQVEDEAQLRYELHRNTDPFPEIDPTLLNSADIDDYVRITGMICPFNKEKLKSASYEMVIGGQVLYWDENDHEISYFLSGEKKEIVLRKNSITFVTVNAKFRLPDYIALRFNLQIEHVHKGILLGTGPLINPGFCGRLMIPLHNLTSNDYVLKNGDALIGVEFTKLSKNSSWLQNDIEKDPRRLGEYKKNSGKKDEKLFNQFIADNVPRGKIVKSSLSGTLDKANKSAIEAESYISKIKNYGAFAIFTVFIALFALAYQVYSLVSDSHNYVISANKELNMLRSENEVLIKIYDEKIKNLENAVMKKNNGNN